MEASVVVGVGLLELPPLAAMAPQVPIREAPQPLPKTAQNMRATIADRGVFERVAQLLKPGLVMLVLSCGDEVEGAEHEWMLWVTFELSMVGNFACAETDRFRPQRLRRSNPCFASQSAQ